MLSFDPIYVPETNGTGRRSRQSSPDLYSHLRPDVRFSTSTRFLLSCKETFHLLLIQPHGMYLLLFHELCSFGRTQPRKKEKQIENSPIFAYGSPTGRMDRHTLVPFLVLLATRFFVVDLFSCHSR